MILLFLALILFFTLMAYLVGKGVSRYVRNVITARLEAINQIVNEEQVPEDWLRRYRRRAERLRASGADERQLVPLKRLARKRALANIEELIRYVKETGVTKDAETKRLVVSELEEAAERWRDEETWNELIEQQTET
jgi:Mg-chelatase subunit ChlI